jgi:tRNA nucleotidyltransferase (CCA-adding enzyme)
MIQTLPADLAAILRDTPELSRAYLVGGCVRDWLLGEPQKDYDVEVFGLRIDQLARALERWGRVDLVGRSFGVVKLTTDAKNTYDFSIPRRDSKTGAGHRGFEVEFDPRLTLEEAAARRDFTINALMYDPREQQLLDFFGGERDLEAGLLRHTSAAFPEDPLRVLRGMQFAARFQLRAAPETIELARSIRHAYGELARERVRDEWFKWAEKSAKPSLGLRFLAATEWIEHFPEISSLRGVPQDPEWHPEGDVFTHTCHCCDALVTVPAWQQADSETRIAWMLAVLAHDFGKAVTTTSAVRHGMPRIVSPGHEAAGGPMAEAFLERIHAPHRIRERVEPLVVNHMAWFDSMTDRGVRRLSKRLEPENISGLLAVMTADSLGRPPLSRGVPSNVLNLAAKAEELNVREAAPEPILLGRHLLNHGLKPGPTLGALLSAAYQAQLEGKFEDLDGALEWVKSNAA